MWLLFVLACVQTVLVSRQFFLYPYRRTQLISFTLFSPTFAVVWVFFLYRSMAADLFCAKSVVNGSIPSVVQQITITYSLYDRTKALISIQWVLLEKAKITRYNRIQKIWWLIALCCESIFVMKVYPNSRLQYSISLFFHMLLRKTRKHLHGKSNLNHSQPHLVYQQPRNSPKRCHQAMIPAPVLPFNIRKHHKQTESSLAHKEEPQQSSSVAILPAEQALKSKYHGRKNIKRIVEDWGLQSKGFITPAQLQTKIQQKTGLEINQSELQQLMDKFGDKDTLDVKGLVSMLFSGSQGVLFNQTLFEANKLSQFRNAKVQNMNQNLKIYNNVQKNTDLTDQNLNQLVSKINSSISRMKHKRIKVQNKSQLFGQLLSLSKHTKAEEKLLRQIEKTINFEEVKYLIQTHKSIDSFMLDPLVRKVHSPKDAFQAPNMQNHLQTSLNVSKSSGWLTKTLTVQQKRAPFDPLSMLNIDQRKKRFDKSKFTAQSEPWFESSARVKVAPNQKEQVLLTLQSQQLSKKQRYWNKLNRVREWRRAEQESIEWRESQDQLRDKRKLASLGQQQQAYNYVNFIKKKWE